MATFPPISEFLQCGCERQIFNMNSEIGIIPREAIITRRHAEELDSFTIFKSEGISITNVDIFSNEKEVWFDGPHTFADVYCNTCMAFLGYKYIAGPAKKDNLSLQGHFLMKLEKNLKYPLLQVEEQRDINIQMRKREEEGSASGYSSSGSNTHQ